MRHLLAAALVSTAIVAAPQSAAAAPTGAPAAATACMKAKIGGKRKCIGRGQFCSRAHQRDYRRYGFKCKRDARGRYRLY
jgi:curli biogenesis system outer membrane secretion channel CsgG